MRRIKSCFLVWGAVAFLMCLGIAPVRAEEAGSSMVRVGLYQQEGLSSVSEGGLIEGYAYEYLMEIAKYTGWQYTFITEKKLDDGQRVPLTKKDCMEMLKRGDIDVMGDVTLQEGTKQGFLFPSFSFGNKKGILTVRSGNTERYATKDLSSLSGKTVGLVAGYSENQRFKDLVRENGGTDVTYVEYSSKENLTQQLYAIQVDAAFSDNFRKTGNEKIVCEFSAPESYFVFSGDKSDYVEQFNVALEKVNQLNLGFDDALYTKWFTPNIGDALILTQEEKEYIAQHPVVQIVSNDFYAPIEYTKENGDSTGMTQDILREIGEMTGLRFETTSVKSMADALALSKGQKSGIISAYANDYQWAQVNDVVLSHPFMNIPVSAIYHDTVTDIQSKSLRVAVVNGLYVTHQAKLIYYSNMICFDTVEQCVQAVNDGVADVTFIPTYSADYYLAKVNLTRIKSTASVNLDYSLGFAFPKDCDATLRTIINKALDRIPQWKLDAIIYQNLLVDQNNSFLTEIVFKQPVLAMSDLSFIVAGIFVVVFVFLSMRRRSIKQRRLNEEKIFIALSSSKFSVWDYDPKQNIIHLTKGMRQRWGLEENHGYTPEELVDCQFVQEKDAEKFLDIFCNIGQGAKYAQGIISCRKWVNDQWSDEYQGVRMSLTSIYDKKNKIVGVVGVTEIAAEELEYKEKASIDGLTKLLNRGAFIERCTSFLQKEMDAQRVTALILIDVDYFKKANDTYGHAYGDQILMNLGERVTGLFRSEDLLGRLGGDEFVILMKNAQDISSVREKLTELQEQLVFSKGEVLNTCSMGAAIANMEEESFSFMYERADQAMYEAKRRGKGRFAIETDK